MAVPLMQTSYPPNGPCTWPSPLLQLATLLSAGDAEARAQIEALHRATPPLNEVALRTELRKLLAGVLRAAASMLGEGLGCNADALLQFANPLSQERALAGTRATLCRLDRYWGGPIQYTLRAQLALTLRWPPPCQTVVLLLSGTAWLDGKSLGESESEVLQPGSELHLEPGTLVLLQRTAISLMLEAAAKGGIEMQAENSENSARGKLAAKTPAGWLELDTINGLVNIQGRRARLCGREAAALRELLRQPGRVTSREALRTAVKVSGHRAVDRVMLGLRNKLGDGVIATLYGVGYVLEVLRESNSRREAHGQEARN